MADSKTDTKSAPKKKVELTPSAYALEKIGAKEDGSPDELAGLGEKYLAAKLERRHGHG